MGVGNTKMALKCNNALCEKNWTLRCSACKFVGYCSTECQKIDWQKGHKKDCKLIIAENKKKKKAEGKLGFLEAVRSGDLAVVKDYVEDVDVPVDLDWREPVHGFSPIWIAAQDGNLVLVRYLAEQGADKNRAIHNGATPISVAAERGHLAVIQYLLEQGADKNKPKDGGFT